MYIFICNRYESKNEDLYIISNNTPFDKDKIHYYKYDNNKKINLEITNHLSNEESRQNFISQKNEEESDELQIIDYPYQSNKIHNNVNEHYLNKHKFNKSFINNNRRHINLFNNQKNKDESKIIKKIGRKKNSFSGLSRPNFEKKINNKIYFENRDSSDIDDTIKGEDNINISKYKMRYKIIKNKNELNDIKNKQINIYNKNNNKNNLIKKNQFNINKVNTQKGIHNNNNKNLILQKGAKIAKIKTKENIKPRINKYNKFNSFNNFHKSGLNSFIDNKNKKNFYDSLNNNNIYYNNKTNNLIHKNHSDNNIIIHSYKDKDNNKNIINKKGINNMIKTKIKKKSE